MAKPITWRNIAGPSFNNSALATAVGAFDRAGSGFGEVSDRLMETQDRIDQQYTNQAIKQALQTGYVDASLNPRADSTAVYEALLGKKKADSDLATASLGRTKTRSDIDLLREQISDAQYRNTDEVRELEMETMRSENEYRSATADTARTNARIREAELAELRKTNKRAADLFEGVSRINEYTEQIEEQRFNELLTAEGIGPGPIPDAVAIRLRQEAEKYAYGPAGREVVQRWARDNKIPSQAYDDSYHGINDALTREQEAAAAGRQLEYYEKAAEAGFEGQARAANGDFSLMDYDEQGNPVFLTKEQAAQRTVPANTDEMLGRLAASGVNTAKLDKDDIAAIKRVRGVFPTFGAFTQIVGAYMRPGGLKRKEMLADLDKGARDFLIAAGLQQADPIDVNLPPLGGRQAPTGSTGPSNQQIINSLVTPGTDPTYGISP